MATSDEPPIDMTTIDEEKLGSFMGQAVVDVGTSMAAPSADHRREAWAVQSHDESRAAHFGRGGGKSRDLRTLYAGVAAGPGGGRLCYL